VCIFTNAYGLTESTSATHLVPFGQRAPIDPSSGVLSVGVPVPSTDCRISEPETSEEASGVPSIGELQMRGPQVATGVLAKSAGNLPVIP